MAQIKLKNVSTAELKDFFKKSDIGSPQKFEILNGILFSKAYPKSKAFIKSEYFDLKPFADLKQIQERIKLPLISTKKMISALNLFKDNVDVEFSVSNSIIEKTKISSGDSSITVASGDLGLVLPPLPEDVWDKMVNVDESLIDFTMTSDDISKMYKMNVIETETTSANVSRIGGIKVETSGILFSNPDSGADSDEKWSHKITNVVKTHQISHQLMFNLRSLNLYSSEESKAYIKQAPTNPDLLMLILIGKNTEMVIVLNKNDQK